MSVYKYQRVTTPGPDGATIYFRNTESNDAVELAEIDGWHYVFAPVDDDVPEQPVEIQWQAVALDDALREQIKAASRPCLLIAESMQKRIREVYSLEDEQYFARIGVGVALGVYAFQPGEREALLEFGEHVEAVREWGRAQRRKLGL